MIFEKKIKIKSSTMRLGVVVSAYNPITHETEAEGSEVGLSDPAQAT